MLAVEPTGKLVLFVDDQPSMRVAAQSAFARIGLVTIVAGDGREGLAIYRDRADEIDVIVTDVVMPGMSGTDMYRAIRAEYGQVPTLLVSGHPVESLEEDGMLEPELTLLRKPFSLLDLISHVKDLAEA